MTTGRELTVREERKLRRDETLVQRRFWHKLRRAIARLPFAADLLAAYYCAIDPATPRAVKAILMGAIAYFIVPTDLLPDFIAWFGYTDDASVLLAALRAVSGNLKPHHREQARTLLRDDRELSEKRSRPRPDRQSSS